MRRGHRRTHRPFRLLGAAALWGAATLASADTKLQSAAFVHGRPIPVGHTCDGNGASVPLAWPAPPAGTASFVIIAEDPTVASGSAVHWVLFDVPGDRRELPAGLPEVEPLGGGAHHGTNDFGLAGYVGPCPPRGAMHQYWFRLYALDRTLGLPAGAPVAEVRKKMRRHVVWVAELMGTYRRSEDGPHAR